MSGLFYVQMNVLGGTIGATSSPGCGSIFWFCFPVEEAPNSGYAQSQSPLPHAASWHPSSTPAATPASLRKVSSVPAFPAPHDADAEAATDPLLLSLASDSLLNKNPPQKCTSDAGGAAAAAAGTESKGGLCVASCNSSFSDNSMQHSHSRSALNTVWSGLSIQQTMNACDTSSQVESDDGSGGGDFGIDVRIPHFSQLQFFEVLHMSPRGANFSSQ